MYKKIMVPLDGSELAECVLPHVEFLVKAGQVGEVVFARVAEPYNFSLMSGEELPKAEDIIRFDAEARAGAEKYLQTVVDRAKTNGVSVRGEVLIGKPSVKLAEYANSGGFDLVMIATHGRSGVSRWVWGSVADRLLRAVCIPILMVRAPGCVPGI
jgi:nucleotide-binding universal stress UspA family protein